MRTYIDNGETIAIDGMSIPKAGGHRLYNEFLELQGAGGAELVPPDSPTLAEAKAAGIEEVRLASERVRFRYCPAGKEIDIRRLAPGYTQAHLDALNAFLDNMLNPVANQASTEIYDAPDMETLLAVLADYRELYGAELL